MVKSYTANEAVQSDHGEFVQYVLKSDCEKLEADLAIHRGENESLCLRIDDLKAELDAWKDKYLAQQCRADALDYRIRAMQEHYMGKVSGSGG